MLKSENTSSWEMYTYRSCRNDEKIKVFMTLQKQGRENERAGVTEKDNFGLLFKYFRGSVYERCLRMNSFNSITKKGWTGVIP